MNPSTPETPPHIAAGRCSGRLAPRHRLALIVGLVAVCTFVSLYAARRDSGAPTELERIARTNSATPPRDSLPFFEQSWVSPSGHTLSAHCSTIATLPSGDLLALWYGGTREGAADVAIYTSRLPKGGTVWSSPVEVIDREAAEQELDRRIKKVGNTVIFPDEVGNLWMVFSTVSVGGWSGSALNIKSSRDEGRTWGESQRLTLNHFLNLSSLVRNKPIYAEDGRVGLPVYHEMATKFPQILWFRPGPEGTVEDYKVRSLSSASGLIQPSLVSLGDDRVLMILRDGTGQHAVHTALSEDNGWTWTEARASNLPNPNAAMDAVRLDDGRILLVYNHSTDVRENLSLAISADEGQTWEQRAVLEEEADREFSYPQVTKAEDGRIHITYTWRRERIRHVAFNTAWLDREPGRRLAAQP